MPDYSSLDMNDSMKVRIPIRANSGAMELKFGGAIPQLPDGTTGELVVPARVLAEQPQWKWYLQVYDVVLVTPESSLLLAMSRSKVPGELAAFRADVSRVDRKQSLP